MNKSNPETRAEVPQEIGTAQIHVWRTRRPRNRSVLSQLHSIRELLPRYPIQTFLPAANQVSEPPLHSPSARESHSELNARETTAMYKLAALPDRILRQKGVISK